MNMKKASAVSKREKYPCISAPDSFVGLLYIEENQNTIKNHTFEKSSVLLLKTVENDAENLAQTDNF